MVNYVKKNKLITAANFKDFDWNKAKLFYHIAKCNSFTKAARVAGIHQSILTRQIQILEKQVGSPLLIRKSGGIVLTRKGEELLAKVTPFFLEIKGFCGNTYAEMGEEKKRTIRIVTTNAFAAYVVNDLIIAYQKNNPHLAFEIVGEDHEIDVILNDADIAICSYNPEAVGIQQEYLFTLEKKLYASTEYLAKYGEPQTVEDLKNHHIISMANPKQYPYADVNWILRLGMPKGEFHQPVYTSNMLECRVDAAKNGIGIISSYKEFSIIAKANFKNILPNIECEELLIYFIFPDYLKNDPDIMRIKDHLLKDLMFLKNTSNKEEVF